MDTYLNYNKLIGISNGGSKMKKLIIVFICTCICLVSVFTYFIFSDSIREEKIEDFLEAKYGYISDNSKYLELDFDVDEKGNTIYVKVEVDDDSYREKSSFSKNVFNNYIKQIEKTAKSEAKGKNVIVNSYF